MTHTDVGAAVVRAAPAQVYAALVSAQARQVWLAPEGMTGQFERFDPRPGGGYRMVLAYDDEKTSGKTAQNKDVVDVRFIELEEARRVVEEADFVSDDPAFAGTMTMTWTLAPVADGTHVTITATGVPDGIDSREHTTAFASTLANLDAYLRT